MAKKKGFCQETKLYLPDVRSMCSNSILELVCSLMKVLSLKQLNIFKFLHRIQLANFLFCEISIEILVDQSFFVGIIFH